MGLVRVVGVLANGYVFDLGKLLWIKNIYFAVLAQNVASELERINWSENLGRVKGEVAFHDFQFAQYWHRLNEQISILDKLLMHPICFNIISFIIVMLLTCVLIHEPHALVWIRCITNCFQLLGD